MIAAEGESCAHAGGQHQEALRAGGDPGYRKQGNSLPGNQIQGPKEHGQQDGDARGDTEQQTGQRRTAMLFPEAPRVRLCNQLHNYLGCP